MTNTVQSKVHNGSEHPRGATESLPEEYEIWVLLTQLNEGMLKASDKELKPYGISSIQFAVLWVVKTADAPPTASELARMVQRRPASMYALLDRMEKQGLLRCVRSTKGKPEVRAVLKKKGEETYHQVRRTRLVIPRILGALSAKEQEQFKTTLRKLRARTFSELAEEPSFP